MLISDAAEETSDDGGEKSLYRVSDASGQLTFSKVKDGAVSHDDLDSGDVFVLDCGSECFVWVGSGASAAEKKNGLGYAHKHLQGTSHALVPITVVKQGHNNAAFAAAIAA